MTEKHFRLTSEEKRGRAMHAISEAPEGHEVIIKPYIADRTTGKNSGYWGYILTPAALQMGYESVEDLHRAVCCELYGTKKVAFAGKVYDLPARTTTHPQKMNREEFDEHCERASALLTGQGVTLPSQETWFA